MTIKNRKSPEQLIHEIMLTRKEAARMLRIDPRTLDKYFFHSDPKKRLQCFRIGNCIKVERIRLLEYFRLKFLDMKGLTK